MSIEQHSAAADPDVMQSWMTTLYLGRPGLLSVCSDADKWAGRRFATNEPGIADAVQYAVSLDRRHPKGVYTQVTTLRENPASGRGGEDLAYGLTHLWADGDFGTVGHKPGPDDLPAPATADVVAQIIAETGLPQPTLWSHSGGGLNPCWVLDDTVLILDDEVRARAKTLTTDWQAIIAAHAALNGCSWDVEVGNLDRLMKLPGSVNRKEGLERPTAITSGSGAMYGIEEVADCASRLAPAAHELVAQAAKEKQERRNKRLGVAPLSRQAPSRGNLRAASGDGPLDVLADVLTFQDVLEPAGFTYEGQHNDGRQKWLRPAAGGDRASSAYSLLCNDHVAINWSERSDLPVGPLASGNKLTIGTLYAHLNYGGDTAEAARDILRAAAGRSSRGPAGRLGFAVLNEVKRRCMTAEEPPQDWGNTVDTGVSVISVRHSEGEEVGWETPISIDRPRLAVFPTAKLGADLAAMVDAVAEQVQVAPDIPAMIALAAVAVAVGGRAQVKIRDGWAEASSLWTATVAGAGERKSAAENPFSDVLRAVEKELRIEAIPEIEMAEMAARVAHARYEDAEKAAIKAKPENMALKLSEAKIAKQAILDLDPVPAPPRLLFGDITPAAMPIKASQQGGRMGVIHSEGTLIKQMAGLYNNGTPETGFALDAYDGKAMPVDRVGRDSIEMESAHLTIGLLIQPVILEQLGRKKDDEMLHNGFVQRFLYGFPASNLGYQDPRSSKPIPPKILETFDARVRRLVNELWRSSATRVLTFTAQASEEMYVFQERQQERLRRGGDLHQMASWASKLPGKLARIAALTTLYSEPSATEIGVERLRAALDLAPYFIAHARLCLDLMGANKDAKLTPARDVLDWLRRRKEDKRQTPFTVRDVQRGVDGNAWGPEGITAETVQSAVDVLVDRGWAVALPPPPRPEGQRGRPPGVKYSPHPLVWNPEWREKEEVPETRLRSA
ncbi:YfjI family protein [Streptantibioticus silvisoli]|uniref:YfjI family protein n=1 Tax=Streptantibioticus silvisoli TaxID=2705255 RepID=A0ABT6W252_9ACTN|nr:YfjI family protein [Streptantibioticus silvisoli]MDI5964822.1 YfjI family protein [Streptantibioticus silvisoli]